MGASDFLDRIFGKFVCVADLLVSVAFSDEKTVLSLQESAQVVLGCFQTIGGSLVPQKLDATGLPAADDSQGALKLIEKIAGSSEFRELNLGSLSSDLLSVANECLNYGFNHNVWELLTGSGIENGWRINTKVGERQLSILGCIWKATPRQISVFLESHNYKRPVIIRSLRDGFDSNNISLINEHVRPKILGIDQEIDLNDVASWFGKNNVIWPVPRVIDVESRRSEGSVGLSEYDEARIKVIERHLVQLEMENRALLKENLDLKMLFENYPQFNSASEIENAGVVFPYSTRLLSSMKVAAEHFWTDFDPHRPPLQKQVRAFIAELAGIPNDRKAAELAGAIKPDSQPNL